MFRRAFVRWCQSMLYALFNIDKYLSGGAVLSLCLTNSHKSTWFSWKTLSSSHSVHLDVPLVSFTRWILQPKAKNHFERKFNWIQRNTIGIYFVCESSHRQFYLAPMQRHSNSFLICCYVSHSYEFRCQKFVQFAPSVNLNWIFKKR